MEEHVTECNQSCGFLSKFTDVIFKYRDSGIPVYFDSDCIPGMTCLYSAGEKITVIPSNN